MNIPNLIHDDTTPARVIMPKNLRDRVQYIAAREGVEPADVLEILTRRYMKRRYEKTST